MPDDVLTALERENLIETYSSRPPYQQNDYVGWISSAKRPETQAARLAQMLDELRCGDVYMKMNYRARNEEK